MHILELCELTSLPQLHCWSCCYQITNIRMMKIRDRKCVCCRHSYRHSLLIQIAQMSMSLKIRQSVTYAKLSQMPWMRRDEKAERELYGSITWIKFPFYRCLSMQKVQVIGCCICIASQ